MSLTPIENKRKKSEIVAGTYPVTIYDMFVHKNAEKQPIQVNGCMAIIVQFINDKKQVHDQMYIMDKGFKQKYFIDMLKAAGVSFAGGQPSRNDCVGKKLYISIQEVHYVNDDEVLFDAEGKPLIDYHIFRTNPIVEGMKAPNIKGDPAVNGVACDMFVTYKNVSDGFTKEEKKDVAKKIMGDTYKLEVSSTPGAMDTSKMGEIKRKQEDLGEVPTF